MALSASELRTLFKGSSYHVRLIKKSMRAVSERLPRGIPEARACLNHANNLSQWPCGRDSPFRVNFQRVGSIKCTWEGNSQTAVAELVGCSDLGFFSSSSHSLSLVAANIELERVRPATPLHATLTAHICHGMC